MVNITLPDDSIKSFPEYPSGFDVAADISQGLARSCVAVEIEGKRFDVNTPLTQDCRIRLITTRDKEALDILRHSSAHVMAEAVQNLYADARLTIGPVVEDGFYYDIDVSALSEDDFPAIEAEMKKIIKEKKEFHRREVSREEALEIFKDNPYKTELINELADDTISIYSQGGFTDLCRGPHIPHTGMIKGFKLMRVSGAYWRADQTREQLQRLYGTAFFDKKELKAHLHLIEEAKKRDHRKLGTRLDLFSFYQEAAGMPFFHARGMEMWNALLAYWRKEHKAAGYVETKTPVMLNRALWEKSGHWENYRENMYTSI
ncbi:MAG TPA: TGS domain-containing protein, partial [Desulfobacteraceae bacterium]|nr:TGS domain-containing protein [Desulfobacteraceae bacterium]